MTSTILRLWSQATPLLHQVLVSSEYPQPSQVQNTIPIHLSFAIPGMGNVIGLLAGVGFATSVRSAMGSTDGEPALTSLRRGNAGLGQLPQQKKMSAVLTPTL